MTRNKSKILGFTSMAVFLAATIGCSGGYESAALNSNGAQNTASDVTNSVSKDVEEIDSKLDAVEVSMSEVSQKIGNLNPLDLIGSIGNPTVEEQLKNLMNPLVEGVQLIRTKLDSVRVQLNLQLAKLDPNNPQHAQIIDKINLLLSKVDLVESRLKEGLLKLADVIAQGQARIEDAIAKLNPANPVTIVVQIAWSQLKPLMQGWQGQLEAAAQ